MLHVVGRISAPVYTVELKTSLISFSSKSGEAAVSKNIR